MKYVLRMLLHGGSFKTQQCFSFPLPSSLGRIQHIPAALVCVHGGAWITHEAWVIDDPLLFDVTDIRGGLLYQ
jgi:hypothetical protein